MVLNESSVENLRQGAHLRGMDICFEQALRDWDVPGLALAVVKDDVGVLSKGYGVRELGQTSRVDQQTIFAVASVTKAFTALALGMLVDEGKVSWDEPVIEKLPGFLLYDPYVTREVTLRDLLSHRTGLPPGDLIWFGSGFGRAEILQRLRYLKPHWSFRSQYGYQNIAYLAAGQMVTVLTGQSWDQFIRERIFRPLGMHSSSTSWKALSHADNLATPHARIDEQVQSITFRNIDCIAPAGGINSNIADMTRWIKFLLAGGVCNGTRLVNEATMQELFSAQTPMPRDAPEVKAYRRQLSGRTHFLAYGLGWMLYDYHGKKIASHTGAIDGMRAALILVPEENLGIVALTNLDFSNLAPAVAFKVLDVSLGDNQRDSLAEWLADETQAGQRIKTKWSEREGGRVPHTKPQLPLERYAGVYEDSYCGRITLRQRQGALTIKYGKSHTGDLVHWHYDTFLVTWRQRYLDRHFATFSLDQKGQVDEITLDQTGWGDCYVFERVSDL